MILSTMFGVIIALHTSHKAIKPWKLKLNPSSILILPLRSRAQPVGKLSYCLANILLHSIRKSPIKTQTIALIASFQLTFGYVLPVEIQGVAARIGTDLEVTITELNILRKPDIHQSSNQAQSQPRERPLFIAMPATMMLKTSC